MTEQSGAGQPSGRIVLAVVAWLWVLVPFVYGVWELLTQVVKLFGK